MALMLPINVYAMSSKSDIANKLHKPNIIYIMVDDLGQEWISEYGSNLVNTPNIDKLAQTGLRFNGMYSMPKCTPTRTTLLSGQYPFYTGWVNHWDVPRWSPMVDGDPKNLYFDWDYYLTFARVLKSRGYKTAIAG
ncbi:MAG: sulfatase-like hydrolase/transferase, partial [Flavobacteriales bacterium]|nr:sulfatase-like hydrolase/transferase [Flavobacteriales bacterium]